MSLNGHVFQFKIDSSDPTVPHPVSSEVYYFAGCSFVTFAKRSRKYSPGCLIVFCVLPNRKDVTDVVSSVAVSTEQGNVGKSIPLRKLIQDRGYIYVLDFDLAGRSTCCLFFCVHLKPEVLSSLRWPSQSLTLWQAAQEKQFTDVVFQVEGKQLAAHKAMLCVSSPVFAAMFSSNMKEAQSGVVNIDDVTVETFEEFLRFIYTGYVKDSPTLETLRGQLSAVADKYDVPALKILCIHDASNMTKIIGKLLFDYGSFN